MASTFRVLNCPTGTWTADVFASTDLSTATDTGVSLSQSAAGIVTGSVSRAGLHMVRLFRNSVRYAETWVSLADGLTRDCNESRAAVDGSSVTADDVADAVLEQIAGLDNEIEFTVPTLTNGGTLQLTQGHDRQGTNAISATVTGTGVGSLDGDDWSLALNTPGAEPQIVDGTEVTTVDANTLSMKFPVTKAESALLKATTGDWSIERVTVSDLYELNPIRGKLVVLADLRVKRK